MTTNRLARLLAWYRANRILYPWRRTGDPYRIWLSEILLQQTRISVAIPFYDRITSRFPTLSSLAAAEPSEFLAQWSGIGYYRRAENMLRCAREINSKYEGRFPSKLSQLLRLPGIGKYTAGALRNLCFGLLTPAIDGNIARVLARITGNQGQLGTGKFQASMEATFLKLGKDSPANEYFQSLMELGERICLPRPECPICPVKRFCAAFDSGTQNDLPRKPQKKAPELHHWYFLVMERKGKYFLVQNPDRRFLKNAWLFPDVLSTKALNDKELQNEFSDCWNITFKAIREEPEFRHAVTFRKIQGHVLKAKSAASLPKAGKWLSLIELERFPTSSVLMKALAISEP